MDRDGKNTVLTPQMSDAGRNPADNGDSNDQNAVHPCLCGDAPRRPSRYKSRSLGAVLLAKAKLTLVDAGALAVQSHAGLLSSVVFGDENGKGVFEAEVLDAQGQFFTIKIDAATGQILAQGAADMMEEQADGSKDTEAQDGSDGETDDDGANNG
jgi:uncharacterized membrane protein YkoI